MYIFLKKNFFHNIMVPPVVNQAQVTCSRDTPCHLQLICLEVDAHLVSSEIKAEFQVTYHEYQLILQ